jgi:hypothetical protein
MLVNSGFHKKKFPRIVGSLGKLPQRVANAVLGRKKFKECRFERVKNYKPARGAYMSRAAPASYYISVALMIFFYYIVRHKDLCSQQCEFTSGET